MDHTITQVHEGGGSNVEAGTNLDQLVGVHRVPSEIERLGSTVWGGSERGGGHDEANTFVTGHVHTWCCADVERLAL